MRYVQSLILLNEEFLTILKALACHLTTFSITLRHP